jgi:hypothetical protein
MNQSDYAGHARHLKNLADVVTAQDTVEATPAEPLAASDGLVAAVLGLLQ